MGNLIRGWKKDEFSAPTSIWKTALDTKCKIVYLYLVNCLENGDDCPPHSQIAKACSFKNKRTSEIATKILHEYGLIVKIHRKKPGKKENDSNRYIIYHPDQVEGLPWIDELTVKKEGSELNSPPVANDIRQGSELNSPPVANDIRQGSESDSLLSQSVSQSVSKNNSLDQIKLYWQKAFKEDISELAIEEILSYNLPLDKVKEIIRKVALYIDVRTNPFAVVIRAVSAAAQGNEWKWNENVVKMEPPKKRGKREIGNDLPKSIQKQMEQETDDQKQREVNPEVDPMELYRKLEENRRKGPSPERIEQRIKELRAQLRKEENRAYPNYTAIRSIEDEIRELEEKLANMKQGAGV